MDTLFQNILTASFHGSLVILAILLLRPLIKKGPKKFLCMLWLLAFIRLVLPFEIQSTMSLQPNIEFLPEIRQEKVMDHPAAPEAELSVDPVGADVPRDTASQAEAPAAVSEQSEPAATQAPAEKSVSPLTVFGIIWLSVSSLFLAFSFYSYIRLWLSVRDAIRVKDAWESEHIETAFILGFIRPRIYIPMGMDPLTRKYILTHERTHLEKGDQWLKLFGYLTLALHWFNPLVWVAYILLCKDIELACDERVVQFMDLAQRKAYSSALLSCSANRIHLAVCPVAFGEVSVKKRIKAVLHYKKPAFWISLVCVLAIIFVAVCLMTNPQEGTQEPEDIPEATEADQVSEPAKADPKDGPMKDLKESEIQYTCQKALDTLREQESFCFRGEYSKKNSEYEPHLFQDEYRRSGEDTLWLTLPARSGKNQFPMEGRVKYGDTYARFDGIYWILEEPVNKQSAPDSIFDKYDPKELTVTFPQGTGVLDGYTLSFQGEWGSKFSQDGTPSIGIFTYTFDDEGKLIKLEQDSSYLDQDGQEIKVHYALSAKQEHPSVTREKIRAAAASAITQEEVDIRRIQDTQVTKIPSNKTTYDMDLMFGFDEMGWNFQNGGWFMKFGAQNPTETGLDLAFEFAGAFGEDENTRVDGSAVTDSTFYLENFQNGTWKKYPLAEEGKNTLDPQAITSGKTFHVDWEDSYGTLPGGFYRIGMYFTLTTEKGDTEQHFCYAKFRIYNTDIKENLDLCGNSLQALLQQENYHIRVREIIEVGRDGEAVMNKEVWKSGDDYLTLTASFLLEGNAFRFANGSSIFNGQGYTLQYEDPNFAKRTERLSVDFVDQRTMELWTFGFEFNDSQVLDVQKKDQQLTVFCDNGKEYIYLLDRDGHLLGMQKFTTTEETDHRLISEMTVVKDSPEEIRNRIQTANDG